ncbi:MAG TPA: GAF domain-containing protein [Dermatophilaceae bacterium]|nr:GAF domain-containing protein [Dermatophilaceae bacterium]
MSDRWLLIETFGGAKPPSVIGVGSTPKRMVPLRTILGRGRSLQAVEAAVAKAVATGTPDTLLNSDGQRRIVAQPLLSYRGDVHGAWVWVGRADQTPPERGLAGAWHFNLSTDTIGGSDDLLDLYGVAPADRQTQRATAEAFTRLVPNTDDAAALALLIRSRPGDEHQAVWAIRRDDGKMRAGHLSCRAVQETRDGTTDVVLRGITQDIGPAEATPTAPRPVVLEQRVLASEARPGEHRALFNLKNMRILRWIDDPLPDLHWTLDPAHPDSRWIHPEDQQAARHLSDSLRTGRTIGRLRLAAEGGDWLTVDVVANIVLLDQHTTAGLLTLRRAEQRSEPPRPHQG